jgi:CheY-like chemotaxis protein
VERQVGRTVRIEVALKEPAIKTSPTRVLIIDDDPLIRSLLVSTLRKDCLVAVATEGSEGFFKALELKPDVAVIDVNMPGWDGLKTLETFRTHPDLKNVKVIMLTADASKQTVMAAIHGGADDYIIKTSFSKADFHRKLNRLVPGTISDISQMAERVFEDDSESNCDSAPHDSTADIEGGKFVAAPQCTKPNSKTESAAALCAASVGANIESRLQELIDGWE